MSMTDCLLALMFALPVLQVFDRLVERYNYRVRGPAGAIPDRVFVFGMLENELIDGVRRDLRFARLKLPIRTWGRLNWSKYSEYGFREHYLFYIEGAPPGQTWRVIPPLEDAL